MLCLLFVHANITKVILAQMKMSIIGIGLLYFGVDLMSLGFYYHGMNAGYWKWRIGCTNAHGISHLPDITQADLKYVAALFDCSISYLYKITNETSNFYKTYYVEKRNGGKRRIDSPDAFLKGVQRWMLEDILYHIPCSKYAKAYVPQTSVKDNAKFHRGQKIVLTIDVKDFFPSITENHVFNVFHQSCGYESSVAVFFTKLCTYNGALPQGAPTSAYLSNLVMRNFDEAVGAYCVSRNIRFTRYADDMTFSGDFDIAALLCFVDLQLKLFGFTRHPEKLKVMRQHDRQKTTGIVVNTTQQVPREYRMKIRQEIHYIKTYGLDSHVERIGEENLHYLQSLLGRINYVLGVNPKDTRMAEYRKYIDALKMIETFK